MSRMRAVLAGLVAVGALGVVVPSSSASSSAEVARAADCAIEDGAEQEDLDPEDSPEVPFARPPGEKVHVYFENAGADDRYWRLLDDAVRIWSRSACVGGETVAACPAEANCVRLAQEYDSGDDTDAEWEGDDENGVRHGGTITLYSKLLDDSTDNGALATIVHEVGHAFGLVHRLNPDDVMNAETDDDTDPNPDDTDYRNLLVIYGDRT
jgi:matrixin